MNSVSSIRTQRHPLPTPDTTALQPLSRPKREAGPPPETAEDSRTNGDRELAMEYHAALLQLANRQRDVKINTIAPDSTFGQWWAQLRNAFKSPEVRQWIESKGIHTGSIQLNPESGQISFKLQRHLDPEQKRHTLGQDDRHWASISEPILQAGRVISAGHADTTFAPPTSDLEEPVPYWLVGHFYKEPLDLTGPSIRQRAAQIAQDQGFKKLEPTTSGSLIKSRSEEALQTQRAHLGDTRNLYQAIAELRHLAARVEGGIEYGGHIRDELKKRTLELSFDRTYQVPKRRSVEQRQPSPVSGRPRLGYPQQSRRTGKPCRRPLHTDTQGTHPWQPGWRAGLACAARPRQPGTVEGGFTHRSVRRYRADPV